MRCKHRIYSAIWTSFFIVFCLFSYSIFSQGNQPVFHIQNPSESLDVVIEDKVFLKDLKNAESEEEFRVLFKPSDSKYISYLNHLGKDLWIFNSYTGVALTITKTDILRLIERNIIKNLWFNSPIFASSDSSHIQSLNLTRDVYDYTTSIGAPPLWAEGFYGNSTKIAILDTGIKQNHPALNQTMEGENRIIEAKNFFDDSTNIEDDNGHGTEVAGIIGSNGLYGFDKGVAPNCDFLIGKVLSHAAQGSVETLIKGIDWALENEVDVINLSLGKAVSNVTSPEIIAINSAVQQGVIVCVAAGNARNVNEFGYNDLFTVLSPGIASQAISVGAIDNNKVLYELSSAGSIVENYDEIDGQFLFDSVDLTNTLLKPDLLAPGVMLNTTSKDGLTTKRVSGTSYSTAVVSGICSLLLQEHENSPPSIIKSSLLETADTQYIEMISPFSSIIKRAIPKLYQGSGLVDCSAASAYLDDPPPIFIWPPIVPFDLNTVFKNTESTFQISLFINEETDNLKISMQSSVSEFVTITEIPEDPDIGQYDLQVTISHEDSYLGSHRHQISFEINNQTVSIQLSYEVVKAEGRILFICDELGDTFKYSLYGSLWKFMTIAKRVGLIPSILARDSLTKLSSLNLNDFEAIALINPNSSEYRSYSEADLNLLSDYASEDGQYNGGAIILFPTINSDLNLINSLLNPFNISYSMTGLTNEILDVSMLSHSLLESPNSVFSMYLPSPLNVTKDDDLINLIANRFAISDQREDEGSLIIASNTINMFLSSPYLYSDITTNYEEDMQSLYFGNNEEILENILTSAVVDEIEIEYALNTEETKSNKLFKVDIHAYNFYKPLSGLKFYLSIQTESNSIFRFSTYEDYQNGSYSFSFIPKNYNLPPGKYRLAIRSSFGKASWPIHILAMVSWGPVIVEVSVMACIALLIVTRRKPIKK
ncbi:MAG: S8 family serine peptidase [Asgard group archaeon]|nr:S8 family serine peptidase [Asgard group archaeon]